MDLTVTDCSRGKWTNSERVWW